VQLTPLSTHWAPRKKNKKRVQSFSDTVYYYISSICKEIRCLLTECHVPNVLPSTCIHCVPAGDGQFCRNMS